MPVDYQTGRTISLWHYSIVGGAADWQTVIHEILGFVAYWASGRLLRARCARGHAAREGTLRVRAD
jgi:hypothetical protein